MEMFRVEPGMSMESGDSAEAQELQQQCRGCGCKLGADVLASALNVAEGAHYEDAAEIATTAQGSMIASTDFFSSPFQDPYLAGRIAALHSASDVIASAGIPTSALANVVLPPGDPDSQRRALADILEGARQEFSAMGASLVGGHTIVGPRMELGFTVIGNSVGQQLIRKANLRIGDQLYLTKPLGTGVLLAAHMRCECGAADYVELVATMLQPQNQWARIAVACGITAGTDITGFGLAGHLLEMLDASHVSAVMHLDAVPALPGAIESLSKDIRSTLAPANRRIESMIEADDLVRKKPKYDLLFDPQTCGGLLLGVPEEVETRMLQEVNRLQLPAPVLIGRIEPGEGRSKPLRLIP
jgi:selenide,water dikinase